MIPLQFFDTVIIAYCFGLPRPLTKFLFFEMLKMPAQLQASIIARFNVTSQSIHFSHSVPVSNVNGYIGAASRVFRYFYWECSLHWTDAFKPCRHPLNRLYNGSLVHGLCQRLPASTSADSLLSMCPEAKQLYECLFSATSSCAPAELFLPKAKSNSKSRRRKKKVASLQTTSDAKPWHDRSNRFGLLMVESLEEHVENSELE